MSFSDNVVADDEAAIRVKVGEMKHLFSSGVTRSLDWRRQQLEGLVKFLDECRESLLEALAADLGKPRMEGNVIELRFVQLDANQAIECMKEWSADRAVATPAALLPAHSFIRSEPKYVISGIALRIRKEY